MAPDGSIVSNFLAAYDRNLPRLVIFESRTKETIKSVLAAKEIKVHSVDGRVKSRSSLHEKAKRIGKSYKSLDDIKDLVGLRIITYFEDEVDALAEIIETEFELVREHCVDKRKSLEPNTFGYLSLHYVCQWPESRLLLTENTAFRGLAFEIQIRSLLQHTWAEIEHDLGYKAGSDIPPTIRRRFSQLAGLLEVADREFREVRETLAAYIDEIRNNIQSEELTTPLDSISLPVFVSESVALKDLDQWLCSWMDAKLVEPIDNLDVALPMLQFCGILTVEHLDRCLRSNKSSFVAYIKRRFPRIPSTEDEPLDAWYEKGSSIWHLAHPLALTAGGTDGLQELLTKYVQYPDEGLLEAVADIARCASGLEWTL